MSSLDLKKIIEMHYRLQYGCFFHNVYKQNNKVFTYNDLMESFIWNHIYCDNNEFDLEELLNETKTYFLTRDRKPCLYIDDSYKLLFDGELNNQQFHCLDNEAWMHYDFNKKQTADDKCYDIGKVLSYEALIDFCVVCSECFDSQHSDAIIREYRQYQPHKRVEHFVLKLDDQTVSIASIYSSGNYFYIHNVATTERYRKRGLAGNLMRYLLRYINSISDSPCVILQCDGGGDTEEFYRNLGFTNIHRRWGYVYEQK